MPELDTDHIGENVRSSKQGRFSIRVYALCAAALLLSSPLFAQDYLAGTGTPTFALPEPSDMGLIDAASGNSHVEIPMGSFPQRGGGTVTLKLAYDSSLWSIYSDGVTSKWISNYYDAGYLNVGGWRLVAPGWASLIQTGFFTAGQCITNTLAQEPNGTTHLFRVNLGTGTPSGNGGCSSSPVTTYAKDASGFQLTASCCSNSAIIYSSIYAPDGTCVWGNPCTDANGNYMTGAPPSNGVDTLGRQYFSTGTGTGCTYTAKSGVTYPECFYVLTSQGTTSPYTLSYSDISLKTNFQQSGVTECSTNCIATVITAVALPDGSSYTFKYDCDSTTGNTACSSAGGQAAYYGLMTSMKVPTGATVTYNYANFVDSTSYVNRRVSSKQTSSGTWSYSPLVLNGSPTNTGACESGFYPGSGYFAGCQQVTVSRPDGSKQVTVFGINNGIWPITINNYDKDGSTVLSATHNQWDYSNVCPFSTYPVCYVILDNGNTHWTNSEDIQLHQTQTTVPVPGGSLTKQVSYTYAANTNSNPTVIKEWKYQSGSSPTFASVPDKTLYISYLTTSQNNVIHPTSVVVCNNTGSDSNCPSGGTRVTQTTISYDAYGGSGSLALQSAPGFTNHDDTGHGVSYTTRGNATQLTRWISGTSQITTAVSYDTTGQIVQLSDAAGHTTSLSYGDNFFSDNGANPPSAFTPTQPTNAYLTKVVDSVGTATFGYYFGSGNSAVGTDYNGISTYRHYQDPFDRATQTDYPIGWNLTEYTSVTQTDSFAAVADTTASTGCVSCSHVREVSDTLGRLTTQTLVNNPSGPSSISNTYDGLNRILTSTHPNFGSSDPNDVYESFSYDGLSRTVSFVHPDGQATNFALGSQVGNLGGLTSPLGSSATYGYGYPTISADEAGKPHQVWIDGFGHVIEADEPTSIGTATHSSGSITIFGQEKCKNPPAQCDNGYISAAVGSYQTTVSWHYSGTGSVPTCGSLSQQLASSLNGSGLVNASASGCTVYLTSVGTGPGVNYVCSASVTDTGGYSPPSFSTSVSSGCMSGGTLPVTWQAAFYTYNALGDLTSVTQGSQARSWQYDGLSRVTQEVTPEAGTVTISYLNSSGGLCSGDPDNPCTRTDARGIVTTYSYDSANRLISKTHTGGTGSEGYSYGTSAAAFNIGRLATMNDPSGSEAYTYDIGGDLSQVQKIISGTSYVTKYAYNAGGQLTGITYPSGRTVNYANDDVGHLCVVAASASSCSSYSTPYLTIASASYDAANRPLSATYGNGIVASAVYSPATAEITSLSYAKGSTTLLGLNYFYQEDSTHCPNGAALNSGQIQCINDTVQPGRSISYSYDSLGRLLTANTSGSTSYPAWGLSETYDQYGNRTNQTVTAGSGYASSLTINGENNQISGYTYDASGNVTAQPAPLSTSFTYDADECLTSYGGNGNNATYTCDGNGLRVKKVVAGANAVTTVYIRSGGDVIAEYDNGAAVNSPTREYIFGNNKVATITGSVNGSGGTITYEHRDLLSPRFFTDANGNCVGDQGTYPYGELWYSNNDPNCSSSFSSPWMFTTYERDHETGLATGMDYALARSYGNGDGRFMSPDPLEGVVGDPQSWNRYAYVEGDPINLTDSSGQGFWEDLAFAIADVFASIFAPEALPELSATEAGASSGDLYQALEAAGLFVFETEALPGGSTIKYWACSSEACDGGNPAGVSAAGTYDDWDPEGVGDDQSATGSGSAGGQQSGTTASSPGTSPGTSPTPTQGGPGNSPAGHTAAGDVWHEVTAAQVAAAVKVFVQGSGKMSGKAVNFLNTFGKNWTLSGANLREGFSIAEKGGLKVPQSGTVNNVLGNINSIERKGDDVVISNIKAMRIKLLAKLDSSIRLTVVSGSGGPALTNIQGISVWEGIKTKKITNFGP